MRVDSGDKLVYSEVFGTKAKKPEDKNAVSQLSHVINTEIASYDSGRQAIFRNLQDENGEIEEELSEIIEGNNPSVERAEELVHRVQESTEKYIRSTGGGVATVRHVEDSLEELLPGIDKWDEHIDAFIKNLLAADIPEEDKLASLQVFIQSLDEKLVNNESKKASLDNTIHDTQKLVVGISIGEKIAEHLLPVVPHDKLQLFESLGATTVLGKWINIGIKGNEISERAKEIKALEAEIAKLREQALKVSPQEARLINDSIASLHSRKDELEELNKEESIHLFKESLEGIGAASEVSVEVIARNLHAHHYVHLVHQLTAAAEGISFGGLVVSFAFNIYAGYKTHSKITQLEEEYKQLEQEKSQISADAPQLIYIIQARQDRIRKAIDEHTTDITIQAGKTFASSMGVVGGVKAVLVGAGLALSASAAVALSVMGISALAIGVGLTLLTVGILANRNKEQIKYFYEIALPSVQKLFAQRVLNKTGEKMGKKADKADLAERTLAAEMALYKVQKEWLQEQRAKLKKEKLSSEDLKTQKEILKLYATAIDERYANALATYNVSIESLAKQAKKKTAGKENVQHLANRIKVSEDKKDKAVQRKKFKTYDLMTLDIVNSVIAEGLKNPTSKAQIEDFLRSHNAWPKSNNVNQKAIFEYIERE